ncbi:MAG TPA: hypothetical protein VG106_14460 [Vicinamibacterales bacterium]|nr:hypothetical protein [Vicinamibacterales bacterium]
MTDEDRDDLKATAENIVHDAEQLKEIELRKLNLEPGREEESHELAGRAKEIADDIADEARAEKELADKLAEES